MINRKYAAITFITVCAVVTLLQTEKEFLLVQGRTLSKQATQPLISHQKSAAPSMTSPNRVPASSSYANPLRENWQEHFESSLKEQGGENLKDIQIIKEKSLVWMVDSRPLKVESVHVTLTDKQDQQSTFRALVDSQTGKVIESWDRPITDAADVRSGFHFKIDERYSN